MKSEVVVAEAQRRSGRNQLGLFDDESRHHFVDRFAFFLQAGDNPIEVPRPIEIVEGNV